jgi:hypothetical protein
MRVSYRSGRKVSVILDFVPLTKKLENLWHD